MSDDGRYVAFVSNASNLTGILDENNNSDVFVRDMENGQTRFISRSTFGNAGNDNSYDPSISANGQIVAYTSASSDLLPAATLNIFKSSVPTPQRAVSDFDGDGLSDYAVYRPNTNGAWYVLNNPGTFTSYRFFGVGTDLIAPADYTGDGRTDNNQIKIRKKDYE